MYSFLTIVFAVLIKICLIQGDPQNYRGGRTGYGDRNSQNNNNFPPYRNDKQFQNTNTRYPDEQQFSEDINQESISDFNTRRPNVIDNKQYDDQSQNSNKRYHDDGVSIGNGHNKNNVVILNEGPRRNFQDSIQPLFGFWNKNQRPRYDSKVVSITNIGNGRGHHNSVIIDNRPDELGQTVTNIQNGFHSSDQNFNDPSSNSCDHGTYDKKNRDRHNSMNTFENQNRDDTDYSYSKIGHGPDNHNTVIINGEVYSSPGTTVIRSKDDGFRNTAIISNNGYHSFGNEENLKKVPKKSWYK